MPYEIRINDELGCVELRLSGVSPHGDHLAARNRALALMRQAGTGKLLVDLTEMDCGGTVSSEELFDFGESWVPVKGVEEMKIAGVVPRDAASRMDVDYLTMVTNSKGLVTRAFETAEAAREWFARDA